jgi:hypothetical protein
VAEEPRACTVCGRTITWRRAWARDWAQVRYCSARCRQRRLTPQDRALEDALRALLDQHGEADPAQISGEDPALREPARQAARRLVAQGVAAAVQPGRGVVEVSTARGPFILRRLCR